MVNLIREARLFRPLLCAASAINLRVITTMISSEARAALTSQLFPALQSDIRQRAVFAERILAGRLVRELAPDSATMNVVSGLLESC